MASKMKELTFCDNMVSGVNRLNLGYATYFILLVPLVLSTELS